MDASDQPGHEPLLTETPGCRSRSEPERLSSLPTDVLHRLCRTIQQEASSTPQKHDLEEMLKKMPALRALLPPAPEPSYLALRLCCKLLRSASDCVRPCISFHVNDMESVEPYLHKLPSLKSVTLDCAEGDSGVNKCLADLHGIVPGLERLKLRHDSADPTPAHRYMDVQLHITQTDVHTNSLLRWHQTLQHLELHNIACNKGDHIHQPNKAKNSIYRSYKFPIHNDFAFLSGFPALRSLHLENTEPQLKSKDLAACPELEVLRFQIRARDPEDPHTCLKLNLSACPLLRELRCDGCQLVELDVSACNLLETLNADDNDIKVLDLSRCGVLKNLTLHTNRFKQLDLGLCSALEAVNLQNNPLESLQVAGCAAVHTLDVSSTDLEGLDVSGCTSLRSLHGQVSPIKEINLSGCTLLRELTLEDGSLSTLDLSGMSSLRELYCPDHTLASLVLTGCTALESLDLHETGKLKSLDLSSCTALKELVLYGSGVAELDLGNCSALQKLDCRRCGIKDLDLSGCYEVLKELEVEGCEVASLDLDGCESLQKLNCKTCGISTLDLTSCVSLGELDCSENALISLDVSSCEYLMTLNCLSNPLEMLCTEGCNELGSVKYPDAAVRT